MILSVLLLVIALSGGIVGTNRKDKSTSVALVALLLCGAACWLEIWSFREGRALATRAEIPAAYHLGIALLWWASCDSFFRPTIQTEIATRVRTVAGIVGGLLLLAASAATVLYDFGPWEIHPVAALPLAIWSTRLALISWPLWKRFAFATVPVCFLLTTLFLLGVAATDTLRPYFSSREESTLDSLGAPAPAIGGNGPLGDGATRRIPRDVNVHFRHEILVRVKVPSPTLFRSWSQTPLYLRSSTLALFESDDILSPIRSGRWLYDPDDGAEDQCIPLSVAKTPLHPPVSSQRHTYFIERKSASHLPLVENIGSLFAESVYEFADDWYQFSPADEIRQLCYTATAPSLESPEVRPSDLQGIRREEIPAIYLQMPPSPLSPRIRELCATFPTDDPLGGIRRYLARQTRYSLHFSTPEDTSPLSDFLFGSGQGHCEHYAAATVLLLRGLGIPSRVAYGYAGGIADAEQQLFAYRDSDFHAWTEILLPGPQWRRFDTTPVVPGAASRQPATAPLPAMAETEYYDFSHFDPSIARKRNPFGGILAEGMTWLSGHFPLATAMGLSLLGGLWAWIGRRRESQPDGHRTPVAAASGRCPPSAFLLELERIARIAGIPRRPGQTWREWLAILDERLDLPALTEEAVTYHYHVTYAGRRRDSAKEAEYLKTLRKWNTEKRFD